MSLSTLDVEIEKLRNLSLSDTEFLRKRDYLLAREKLKIEVEKQNAENRRALSFASPTTVIATAAILVSGLQLWTAMNTSKSQTAFNKDAVDHQKNTLDYQKNVDGKKARQELGVKFAEFVVKSKSFVCWCGGYVHSK